MRSDPSRYNDINIFIYTIACKISFLNYCPTNTGKGQYTVHSHHELTIETITADFNLLLYYYACSTIVQVFSRNSEAFASEFLENS